MVEIRLLEGGKLKEAFGQNFDNLAGPIRPRRCLRPNGPAQVAYVRSVVQRLANGIHFGAVPHLKTVEGRLWEQHRRAVRPKQKGVLRRAREPDACVSTIILPSGFHVIGYASCVEFPALSLLHPRKLACLLSGPAFYVVLHDVAVVAGAPSKAKGSDSSMVVKLRSSPQRMNGTTFTPLRCR